MPDDQPTPLPYVPAMAELEEILAQRERSDRDIDTVATSVARAAELIATCRGRIGTARMEVERIVADLGPDS